MKILLCLGLLITLSYAALPYYRHREYGENAHEYPQRKYYGDFEEEKGIEQEFLPLSVHEEHEEQAYQSRSEVGSFFLGLLLQHLLNLFFPPVPPTTGAPPCSESKPSETCEIQNNMDFYNEPDTCRSTNFPVNEIDVNLIPRISGNGKDGCDRSYCPGPNDVISVKFFNDHICVYNPKTGRPDISVFCPNYRPDKDLYQAMIITPSELTALRKDMQNRQNEFYTYRNDFPPILPPPSNRHFFTASTYNFYQCTFKSGKWVPKQLSNRYQAFIPRGTAGDPKGLYQIYHGCPPTTDRPPSGNAPGNC